MLILKLESSLQNRSFSLSIIAIRPRGPKRLPDSHITRHILVLGVCRSSFSLNPGLLGHARVGIWIGGPLWCEVMRLTTISVVGTKIGNVLNLNELFYISNLLCCTFSSQWPGSFPIIFQLSYVGPSYCDHAPFFIIDLVFLSALDLILIIIVVVCVLNLPPLQKRWRYDRGNNKQIWKTYQQGRRKS